MSILREIQHLLESGDRPSFLQEPTEEFPNERLLVPVETFGRAKEEILEITAHPQSFKGAFAEGQQTDSYHLLQFQLILPISINPETFNQVSSCLHFFNRLLQCPGFELDELSDQIVYRYVWFIKKKGIDSFLLMQVIGNLILCFNMFSPYIKEIAQGKYTLEEILSKATNLPTSRTS